MTRALFRSVFSLVSASLLACSSSAGSPADAVAKPQAPYTQTLLDRAHIGSDSSMPDFEHADADVELTGAPFAHVNLVVDLESPCFPWSKWQSDPPPSGQNWPADCDAFDRNFEMSLVDPIAPQGSPGLELVRAITPFGGPEHIEQDVTDAFNVVQGKRAFHVTITAYPDPAGKVSGSRGGWYVSAHLDVTPGSPPANVLAVIALYYDSVTAGQTIPDVPFTMPPGTTSSRLEYRATGHGGATAASAGCFGPADEFCRRLHHVVLDGQEIEQATPWRNDCDQLCTLTDGGPFGQGQYCAQNPCGGLASVPASRANWCPGSVTPPLSWMPAPLSSPGAHTFHFSVDGIAPGGQWRVSAVAYAYGK
jgi:peptide-N-glycosidase F-like protein